MRWSTRIGTLAGIGIYIHWTFWLLIAWIVVAHMVQGGSPEATIASVTMVAAVFACVVLHELGHALAARRFGIETHDITLLPIGGVARLARMPEQPLQELWVALAGPAVNVVIAAVVLVALIVLNKTAELTNLQPIGSGFLIGLMWINILLVGFNLIPAFPMDGGRVLRALLATRFNYMFATQVAAAVGQGIAILFAIVGLLVPGMWMLLFIALFVFLGAQQESQAAEVKSLLRGVPVRAAVVTRFRTLRDTDPLSTVVSELLAGYQTDFPVIDAQNRLVGILVRSDLMQALAQGRADATVGELMRPHCFTVDDSEMLERTFQRMREADCPALPVVNNGQLVGLITMENIAEWMMIHSALKSGGMRSEFDALFQRTG